MRTVKDYIKLVLKGMLMGAADSVPGVSGGTMALITGIYEELIDTLKSFNLQAVKVLFKEGPVACWKQVNGSFLLCVLAGIGLSLVTLSRVVLYLLDNQPILIWSFFFGLVLASVWTVARYITHWNSQLILAFAVGTAVAYIITSMVPGNVTATTLTIFGAGFIAICAMILPGISGSFILLLMGMYAPIMAAIKNFELGMIAVFGAGCAIGLLSFSHVLSWAFHHHRQLILALMSGFLLGSLNKIWPWKYTISYTVDSHDRMVPLLQQNVLPSGFTDMTGLANNLWPALAVMAIGAVLVLVLDRRNP